jgi:hypothetical protein
MTEVTKTVVIQTFVRLGQYSSQGIGLGARGLLATCKSAHRDFGNPLGERRLLREGDVLMLTRIDRLARSIGDLEDIVRPVKARGASLKATEQPIDTSTAARWGAKSVAFRLLWRLGNRTLKAQGCSGRGLLGKFEIR